MNKKIVIGVVILLLVIAALIATAVFWPRQVIVFDQTNETFLVKGDVKIKRAAEGSQWEKMSTSTVLEKGDSIETGEEALTDIIIGGDADRVIRVGQNSSVVIESVNPTVINLPKGKVMVSLKKLESKSSFVVKTPVAICGARGTAWSQEASGDMTKICVFENSVYIQSVDAGGRVRAKKYITDEGTQRVIERGKPMGSPEAVSQTALRLWEQWNKSVSFLRDGKILVDDFDAKEYFNNLDGSVGSWNMFYSDPNQFCRDEFTEEVRVGDQGYGLKLTYDVDTTVSAYNGFFTKLMDINLTDYKYLVFYIKGDKDAGFTTRVNLELKNSFQIGRATFEGITDEWQRVVMPISRFVGLSDLKEMKEFVVVFSDIGVTKKEGVIYLDDIYFAKSEPEK